MAQKAWKPTIAQNIAAHRYTPSGRDANLFARCEKRGERTWAAGGQIEFTFSDETSITLDLISGHFISIDSPSVFTKGLR